MMESRGGGQPAKIIVDPTVIGSSAVRALSTVLGRVMERRRRHLPLNSIRRFAGMPRRGALKRMGIFNRDYIYAKLYSTQIFGQIGNGKNFPKKFLKMQLQTNMHCKLNICIFPSDRQAEFIDNINFFYK